MDQSVLLAELLQRFFRGESAALGDIARSYRSALLAMIHGHANRPRVVFDDDSDDVSQQALLDLWHKRRRLRPKRIVNAIGYLQRLLTNRARAQRRYHRALRRNRLRNRSLDRKMSLYVGAPDQQLRALEGQECLRQVVKRLTAPARLLVAWRLHGRSWKEIGERLRRSPESLRSQYRRAVQKLRIDLELDL